MLLVILVFFNLQTGNLPLREGRVPSREHRTVQTRWYRSFSVSMTTLSEQQDRADTERLLSADNIDQEALLSYAREAADFGTDYQLPSLDYAINHYGHPDVAMFDFTCMYASENAALIREKRGHQLVVALVGDSLLEVSRTIGNHLWMVDLIS